MGKVMYGFTDIYVAKLTEEDGSLLYETPMHIPGAVSFGLEYSGDKSDFYADDGVYYTEFLQGSTDITVEIAGLEDDMYNKLFNFVTDDNGLSVEDIDAPSIHVALLFGQSSNVSKGRRRFVFYNTTLKLPGWKSETKKGTVEPSLLTLEGACTAIEYKVGTTVKRTNYGMLSENKAKSQEIFDNFFNKVMLPFETTNVKEAKK